MVRGQTLPYKKARERYQTYQTLSTTLKKIFSLKEDTVKQLAKTYLWNTAGYLPILHNLTSKMAPTKVSAFVLVLLSTSLKDFVTSTGKREMIFYFHSINY